MECRDVRELADSFLSEQLLVETTHDILRHLAQCPSCRAEMESRRRLRTALRGAFERSAELRASPEFLASVGRHVRDHQSSRSLRAARWSFRPMMAIAASLLLVSAVAFGGREWLGASLLHAALGDHQNCAIRFRLKEKPISLEDAAQRFEPAYRSLVAVAPSPARLSGGELTVLERHSCVYDRRRFAHIVLRYRGTLVSVLVTPDRLARVPSEVAIEGTRVSSFRAGRFAAFVVSSASDAEMREIAAAVAGPLKNALAGA
jgi:anti-sigma factor RsiW